MILYRLNNPNLGWSAEPGMLAAQFWAGSRQASWLLRAGGDPARETAGAVSAWLRDPLAHQSSWDDMDGFSELVRQVLARWPLAGVNGTALTEAELAEVGRLATLPEPGELSPVISEPLERPYGHGEIQPDGSEVMRGHPYGA